MSYIHQVNTAQEIGFLERINALDFQQSLLNVSDIGAFLVTSSGSTSISRGPLRVWRNLYRLVD